MKHPAMTLEINQTAVVKVKASKKHSANPVLHVKKGEVYRFEVPSGQCWYDMGIPSKSSGYKNIFLSIWSKRVPSAKCFTLCGTVGKDENHHFAIGSGLEKYVPVTDGDLYFFANDNKHFYWNNWGSLNVEVSRIQ